MFRRSFTIAAVAAASTDLALATNTGEQMPKVERVSEVASPWAYADFATGLALGGYGSFARYAYDDSCFTQLYTYAFDTIGASDYYVTGSGATNWYEMAQFYIEIWNTYPAGFYQVLSSCGSWYDDGELETRDREGGKGVRPES